MKKNTLRFVNILRYLCLFLAITLGLISILGSCGGGGGDLVAPTANFGPNEQVNFSNVVLDHVEDYTITLQNNGTARGGFGQIDPAGLQPPFSIVSDSCSGKIFSPSQSCSIQVRFAPTVQGFYNDNFIIPGPTGLTVKTVYVSGDGTGFNASINQVLVHCPPSTLTPQIELYVSVTEANDNPATGLPESAFTIYEDNTMIDKSPPDPNDFYFNTPITDPVSVVLLLDYSGSVGASEPQIRTGAHTFIDELDFGPDPDEAEIIKFATLIDPMSGFASDKTILDNDIETVPDPPIGSGTALYDALQIAIDDLSSRTNDRKAIVIITDGDDLNSSVSSLDSVIDSASVEGIPIFTVGVGTVYQPVMDYLADNSGGQYFQAPPSGDLTTVFFQVGELLAGQYLIRYATLSSGVTIALDLEVESNISGDIGKDSISVEVCP